MTLAARRRAAHREASFPHHQLTGATRLYEISYDLLKLARHINRPAQLVPAVKFMQQNHPPMPKEVAAWLCRHCYETESR